MNSIFNAISRPRTVATAALALSCLLPCIARATSEAPATQVQLTDGALEGVRVYVGQSRLRAFRGIPYAAPPVGPLRWREPQQVARWPGVRTARAFGPGCMQWQYEELAFRSEKKSEDCLYLNVWTPARSEQDKLPVLVYFHGGGFQAGDGSERRYDGARLAARGIVTVTVNYRLGLFGFLALPESARESPQGAAGNYGMLDQVAALRWVRDNIASFGGDPGQVTIAGNAAGAISVSAHMASPLSRGLFARAIGESGAAFAPIRLTRRAQAEKASTEFAIHAGAPALEQLRAMPADTLLAAMGSAEKPRFQFWASIDGYFLSDTPESVFESGAQANVPLLVGNNSQERHFSVVLDGQEPTPDNWRHLIKALFRHHADEALMHYPGNDVDEVMRSGTALGGNLFDIHSTWRWMDLHRRTSSAPVYFYLYTHPHPTQIQPINKPKRQPVMGAAHAAEIEYALDNLDNESRDAWTAEDREVSRIFSGYVAQFVKTGNPNDDRLPQWPAAREEGDGLVRQVIGPQTHTIHDADAARQAFMQRFFAGRRPAGDPN